MALFSKNYQLNNNVKDQPQLLESTVGLSLLNMTVFWEVYILVIGNKSI